ncbi:hypothetical protein GCM10027080_00780 [Pedococcus soli]
MPSGAVSTTDALTASWPSRKTVAVTVNCSPTTDFAGRAPRSTTGLTSWTGMRPIGVWGGRVVGGGAAWGRVPVLPVEGASGEVGVVAGGVAVTRPTLLGLGPRAPPRASAWAAGVPPS